MGRASLFGCRELFEHASALTPGFLKLSFLVVLLDRQLAAGFANPDEDENGEGRSANETDTQEKGSPGALLSAPRRSAGDSNVGPAQGETRVVVE